MSGLRLIKFQKKGLLDQQTFEHFLDSARRVADFDRVEKVWVINWRKVLSLDIGSLREALSTLEELSSMSKEDVQFILNVYEKKAGKKNVVFIDSGLRIHTANDILNLLLSDYFKKIVIFKFNKPYLRSIVYLKSLIDLLHQKYGIKVEYEPGLLSVKLFRREGFLVAEFSRIDRELFKLLADVGTIEYYEERVKLGPNKEYMGTEYIPRKLRFFKVDWSSNNFETSVGLLERLKNALTKYGFSINTKIEEIPDLKINIEKKFKLFPHQEEALMLWLRKKRGTIAIFTRGGKSFIAIGAVYELKKPTLILVPTKELTLTWKKYLVETLGLSSSHIGILGGGEQKIKEITIAIYNSAVKYLDKLIGKFEFVVFDEAHHVPANTFKEVALRIDSLYRMALSATPTRRDGNEKLLFTLCGDLIYKLTYEDLLRLKIVAPLEKFETFFANGPEEKFEILSTLVSAYADSKIIIFTQYLRTAKEIYEKLKKNGFKVELITGETPEVRREQAFRKFLDGRVNIIVTTTVLDEGITVPDAEVAIIYEGTGEGRQMIQRIGRVLGYHPGKTAKVFEIVDITNPKEKSAYRRRSWVRELYRVRDIDKYIKAVKEGKEEEIRGFFQRRIDSF